MGAGIVATILTFAASAAAAFFAPAGRDYQKLRIVGFWALAGGAAFVLPTDFAAYGVIILLLLFLAPMKPIHRVYVFIATFAALPYGFNVSIPFPGLNYLIDLNFAKLSAIILLGPVFFARIGAPTSPTLRSVDVILFIYVLMTGLMSIRDVSFTSMLRTTLDQFLIIFIPYFSISRTIRSQDEIENALKSFFLGIVVAAFVGIASTVRDWNYYTLLDENVSGKSFTDRRNGFLRIGATTFPTMLGYLMGTGIAAASYFRSIKMIPSFYYFALIPLFAFVCFVTGARGGWLSAFVVVIVYYSFLVLNNSMRRMLLIASFIGVIGVLISISGGSNLVDDQYGTIQYRAELLRTSFVQIADRPLFGSSDFLASERFAHLKQGEGIIDLVNGFLQVALYYGLVGLALFLVVNGLSFFSSLKKLERYPKLNGSNPNHDSTRRLACLLLATHAGFLIMISTVSAVSYAWQFLFVILGICVAFVRAVEAPIPNNLSTEQEFPVEIPESAATSGERANTIPYGARFVRRQ